MSFVGIDALPLMIVTLFITYFHYCYFYYKCYYYHSDAPIFAVNNGINRHLRNGGNESDLEPYSLALHGFSYYENWLYWFPIPNMLLNIALVRSGRVRE